MTENIFVDTDVIFDLLAKREPFYKYSAKLFTHADKQELTICVSSLCFGNLNYILSKQKSATEARKILSRFKVLVKVLPVDDKVIELALNSDFVDFEDQTLKATFPNVAPKPSLPTFAAHLLGKF